MDKVPHGSTRPSLSRGNTPPTVRRRQEVQEARAVRVNGKDGDLCEKVTSRDQCASEQPRELAKNVKADATGTKDLLRGRRKSGPPRHSTELDCALARIAFRALSTRDADKLRLLTADMSPSQLEASVRTAAHVFANAVYCAIDGSACEADFVPSSRSSKSSKATSQIELASILRGEKIEDTVAKAARVASQRSPERQSRKRFAPQRSQSAKISRKRKRTVEDVDAEMKVACAELRSLSQAFTDMTVLHRQAVLETCHDALRTAQPALVLIEKQFAGGLEKAAKSTADASRRVALLAEEQDSLVDEPPRSSSSLSAVAVDITTMTERVGVIAAEANLQSRKSAEVMTEQLARVGFSGMISSANSRLDTRKLLPRRKIEDASRGSKSTRASCLLNLIDSRSVEVSEIVAQFNDDVQRAVVEAKMRSQERVSAMKQSEDVAVGMRALSRKGPKKKNKLEHSRRSSMHM